MNRRHYGTGTLTEAGPGRWKLRWDDQPDPFTGKRRRRGETYTGTKKDAAKRLAQHRAANLVGQAQVSLGDVITHWRAEAGHQLGTARNYTTAVATIPATFLALPIADIRATMIADLCKRVLDQHGVHRARLVHAVVSGGLTHAWRREWLHDNPARRVKPPSAPKAAPHQPTPAQVRTLLALVADQPQMLAWFATSADTGARRGEVLALRWSRIRLDTGEVRIDQALDPIDAHTKTTKTGDERTVALSATTLDVLETWRLAQRARAAVAHVKPVADPFVFSDVLDGSVPWRPDVATKRFARLRDRAGIEGIHLHSVRHYVATELLAAGIDLKTVSGRLGHSRVATTSDVYAHAIPARDRHAADTLAEVTRTGR